jgi:DNA polymerase III subunit epsilon
LLFPARLLTAETYAIAASFMDFVGDGVFVAHNVYFDYGLLAREHERLERRSRFPKACTCASMRRLFPGRRSYSIGNLYET